MGNGVLCRQLKQKAPFNESRVARWIKLDTFSALRDLYTASNGRLVLSFTPGKSSLRPSSDASFNVPLSPPSLPPSTASCMYHGNVDPPERRG